MKIYTIPVYPTEGWSDLPLKGAAVQCLGITERFTPVKNVVPDITYNGASMLNGVREVVTAVHTSYILTYMTYDDNETATYPYRFFTAKLGIAYNAEVRGQYLGSVIDMWGDVMGVFFHGRRVPCMWCGKEVSSTEIEAHEASCR